MNWRARVERGRPILYKLPPQNIYSYLIGYCAELEERIEAVQERLDEITTELENIVSGAHGQIKKSELMREVEERFRKSIYELLEERKGRSVRKIADELGVSKSTIANWLKEVKNERNCGRISKDFERN